MSTSRAITQLLKSHAELSKKLSNIEEEKNAVLDSVNEKYNVKSESLKTKHADIKTALLALGIQEDEILANGKEE